MVSNALGPCDVGCVDMNSVEGTAGSEGLASVVRDRAGLGWFANRVIVDHDFGGSGAISYLYIACLVSVCILTLSSTAFLFPGSRCVLSARHQGSPSLH